MRGDFDGRLQARVKDEEVERLVKSSLLAQLTLGGYHGRQTYHMLTVQVLRVVKEVRVDLVNQQKGIVVDMGKRVDSGYDQLRLDDDVRTSHQQIQVVDDALLHVHEAAVTEDVLDLGERLDCALPQLTDVEGDACYHA